MKKGTLVVIIFIFAILQSTVFNYLRIWYIKPDLLLIGMVLVSLSLETKWALILSVFAGILKDVLTLNAFGINTLLFPLWGFLIINLSKKVLIENNLIRSVLVFIIVIANGIVSGLINVISGSFIPGGIFLRVIFLESLYTTAVSSLVFRILLR